MKDPQKNPILRLGSSMFKSCYQTNTHSAPPKLRGCKVETYSDELDCAGRIGGPILEHWQQGGFTHCGKKNVLFWFISAIVKVHLNVT
jgi:hypothetical protein